MPPNPCASAEALENKDCDGAVYQPVTAAANASGANSGANRGGRAFPIRVSFDQRSSLLLGAWPHNEPQAKHRSLRATSGTGKLEPVDVHA
jgi:hypothetical protein